MGYTVYFPTSSIHPSIHRYDFCPSMSIWIMHLNLYFFFFNFFTQKYPFNFLNMWTCANQIDHFYTTQFVHRIQLYKYTSRPSICPLKTVLDHDVSKSQWSVSNRHTDHSHQTVWLFPLSGCSGMGVILSNPHPGVTVTSNCNKKPPSPPAEVTTWFTRWTSVFWSPYAERKMKGRKSPLDFSCLSFSTQGWVQI